MGKPLRILALGAHPDDCEWACGGTAVKWVSRGDQVRFVSLTNGELGHWQKEQVGAPLAKRRKAEAFRAAEFLGTDPLVLDTPDGTLSPSLENRRWYPTASSSRSAAQTSPGDSSARCPPVVVRRRQRSTGRPGPARSSPRW